ncbi:MAG: 7-carboxy-7-deazaguanine synthase [FCB group bacterium]|nr:7-carboxy-7-deazaguanine synthase [FCB group bacterium]
MRYAVKEVYYTLQGEGKNTGRPAVFVRFSGCNLWTGREADRDTAICPFCDTDFLGTDGPGGDEYSREGLVRAILAAWPGEAPLFVVFTGGEPTLQLDAGLVDALHAHGAELAVETNGTRPLPPGLDWITVSPKAGTDLVITEGQECKLVFPQPGMDPADFLGLSFDHFLLQPLDSPDLEANTRQAVDYCLKNPRWTLSLQTHKLLNLP